MERNPRRWTILAIVASGLFMIMLQGNVINIALPRIQAELGIDLTAAQWITNAYLLVFSMLLITFGRLGDAFGRKLAFSAGLVFYVLGALWNGFAASLGLGGLIAGSVIQGIGGAAMMPATQALIAANFERDERGMALGIWGAVSGLAAAVGPTLGGLLTEYGLGTGINAALGVEEGWRYVYWLSALIGSGVLAAALALVPESKDREAKREYDLPAILLSSAAVFLLVYGLINGRNFGWWEKKAPLTLLGAEIGTATVAATPFILGASLICFLLLVLQESLRKKERLIDPRLFADRDFTAGSLVASILSFAMMGVTFLVPVFLQGVLGFGAVKAGLVMLPLALAVALASPLSAALVKRLGARTVVASGLAVLGAGAILVARFSPLTTPGSLVLPFLVMGAGIGLAMGPITTAALAGVAAGRVGAASGLLSMIRQLGSVLGIAIFATVFSASIPVYSTRRVEAIDPAILPAPAKAMIIEGLASGTMGMGGAASGSAGAEGMFASLPKERAEGIKAAMADGMKNGLADSVNATLRTAALAAALGALAALAMRGRKGVLPGGGDAGGALSDPIVRRSPG